MQEEAYHKVGTPINSWNIAISDAETMLREAKERVVRLKRTITILKENRDSGVPFPTNESDSSLMGQESLLGQSQSLAQ
jgi:hypothetical protein